jgi:hypothetical protein
MTNKQEKNNVVGVLKLSELQVCIEALEKLEKEVQAIVDGTPDSALDDEWAKWQGVAVSARNALGAFRLIADRATRINANPDTAYTIHWEGSLKKALDALGVETKRPIEEE